MYYTYILKSERIQKLYIGYTSNLKKRLKEHNQNKSNSYTYKTGPYRLVFYEAFLSKQDAQKQEKFYKTGYGREILRGKIANSINLGDSLKSPHRRPAGEAG